MCPAVWSRGKDHDHGPEGNKIYLAPVTCLPRESLSIVSEIPRDVKGEKKSTWKTKKRLRELRLKTVDVLVKLNTTYKPFC